MKRVLICLSVLVTLCQTYDNDRYLYLRTGEKTGASSQDGFIKKYLENNSAGDELDAEIDKSKAENARRERESNERLDGNRLMDEEDGSDEPLRWAYQLDPDMNVKRRADAISDYGSSSREFQDWKEEWKELWKKRKAETKNYSTYIEGDFVNMIAARPWGVPCGDPAQHDMPWGSCILPVECNAEYRIYKGDYFCGRTQFVCCSLNLHTYDLYQGLDASFEQSSMEIDSAEERERAKKHNSKENHKRRGRGRKRRVRLREERKRKINRTIAKIVKEVQRVLEKGYKNASKVRKRKTNTMKKFIKYLKKQYQKDREAAKDIHEQQIVEVDQDFLNKLMQIRELNHDFMTNETFRNIIVNRTISLRTAKWLAQSYPELEGYLPIEMQKRDSTRQRKENARRLRDYSWREDTMRRRGYPARQRGRPGIKGLNMRLRGGIVHQRDRRKHIDYDVEYGLMYS